MSLAKLVVTFIYKANKMQEWQHKLSNYLLRYVFTWNLLHNGSSEFPTKMYKGNIPLSTFGKLDVDWSISGRKRDPVFRTISLDPRMVILEISLRKI